MKPFSVQLQFWLGALAGGLGFILKTVLLLILTPWLIGMLGVKQYGAYLVLLGLSELLQLAISGFSVGMVQRYSYALGLPQQSKRQRLPLLSGGFWLYLGLSLVVLSIGAVASPYLLALVFKNVSVGLRPQLAPAFGAVLVTTFLLMLARFPQSLIRAHNRQSQLALMETVQSILEVLATAAMAQWMPGLAWLFLGRCAVAGVVLLWSYVSAWQSDWLLRKAPVRQFPGWGNLKDMLQISSFAMIQQISVFVAHRMDGLVISRYLGLAEVAIFELVARLFGQISALCIKVFEGLFPVFARFGAQEAVQQEQADLTLLSTAAIHWLVTLGLLCLLFIFPEAFGYLSKQSFKVEAAWPVAILVACLTWTGSIQIPASNYLFATGHHRFQTVSTVITAALNLIISLVLVQSIGIVGVIWGSLIPHGLQHHLVTIPKALRQLRIPYGAYLLRVFLPSLLPLLIVTTTFVTLDPLFGHSPLSLSGFALKAMVCFLIAGFSSAVWLACLFPKACLKVLKKK
jgi:O-antigen/teichoic acid export membrane protein